MPVDRADLARLRVEIDGRPVAHLDAPEYVDMFWQSWRITPTTADPALAADLLREQFWLDDSSRWTFRSRALGLAAPGPLVSEFVAPARVSLRGLYLDERDLEAARRR
jgi:hypothetical protein